tara:strand:- start:56 stop:1120 length:1065 start_codon:yes stop_codon:yes gene_type:complete
MAETRRRLGTPRQPTKKVLPLPSADSFRQKWSEINSRVEPLEGDSIVIHGMKGIGDQLFQAPYIKELASRFNRVYWDSDLADLLWDMPPNVRFFYSPTRLRMQREISNESLRSGHYCDPKEIPRNSTHHHFRYLRSGPKGILRSTVWDSLNFHLEQFGYPSCDELQFHMKTRQSWENAATQLLHEWGISGPFAIVKSLTLRHEWYCPARNCKQEYMQHAVNRLASEMPVIEIGSQDGIREYFEEGPYQNTYRSFTEGELTLPLIAALCKKSAVTVTPSGFLQVLTLMFKCPTVVIYGGYTYPGTYHSPQLDYSRYFQVGPRNPCRCVSNNHNCNKEIPIEDINKALDEALWTLE